MMPCEGTLRRCDGPRRCDVIAGGNETENTHRRIESRPVIRFTSAYHILATLNDRRQTRDVSDEREGQKKLVSPLFTVDHSWILHKQSEKERD